MPDDDAALAAFGYELGVLKRMRRTGWWHAGVRDPLSSRATLRPNLLGGAAYGVAKAGVGNFMSYLHMLWGSRTRP